MNSFLIVDEDKDLRKLYEMIIKVKQVNPRIDHAENVRDALIMVENHNYSVIISDIETLAIDDIEFYQAMKAKFPPLFQKTVFIDEFESSYLGGEGCQHLSKPFHTKDLWSSINSVLKEE